MATKFIGKNFATNYLTDTMLSKLHFKIDIILKLWYNYVCRRFGYG